MLSTIFGWILVGLVAGVVGKLVMPGKDPGGLIVTVLLGIAGALLAGYLGQALGFYGSAEPISLIGAAIGAALLLVVYRLVMKART